MRRTKSTTTKRSLKASVFQGIEKKKSFLAAIAVLQGSFFPYPYRGGILYLHGSPASRTYISCGTTFKIFKSIQQ